MGRAMELTSDDLWVLTGAVLVFLMQPGFLLFEVGQARPAHAVAVAMKNAIDWALVGLVYSMFGFALMFGDSVGGLIGLSNFFGALDGIATAEGSINPYTFMVFQLAFAGTTATIVSGSLVERISFSSYVILTLTLGAIVYPIVGHWTWGGLLSGESVGFLAALGFYDFAGSTVVHVTGGAFALVGVLMVGPRLGRFSSDGVPRDFEQTNPSLTVLGTMLLWLGWFGFNGASTLALSASVPRIILVTNLSACAGLVGAFFWAWARQGRRTDMIDPMVGGALSGLVSITASADVATVPRAIVLGGVAGAVYMISSNWLLNTAKVDDALNAIPVHLVAGSLGTLAVPFVAPAGTFDNGFLYQIQIQVVGLLASGGFVIISGLIVAGLLRRFLGLRVSPNEELRGSSIANRVEREAEREVLTSDELEALL